MPDDLLPRVNLLERLQAQQDTLNALLITVTTRLEQQQAVETSARLRHSAVLDQHAETMASLRSLTAHQHRLQEELRALMAGLLTRQDDQTARLERHAERLALHEDTMAALRQILAAIKDMLDRGNGH